MPKQGRPKLPPRVQTKPYELSPVGKLLDEVQRNWEIKQRKVAKIIRKKEREGR